MSDISIPYHFQPRDYQLALFQAMDAGYRRAITVWHRRAGKDKALWNLIIKKAIEVKGQYYYLFPEFKQGRRVIWEGIDNDSFSFLDHIPKQLVSSINSQDMTIKLIDPTGESDRGSIITIIGTDKFDKIRGSNPKGCVFSEFAYQNPGAWDVVRPILAANKGWAVFNSTPNGKNHMHTLWEMTRNSKSWFRQFLTVMDTIDPETGERYITDEALDEERFSGYSEEMIQQEFFCDWTANAQGFYYLQYLIEAEEDNRVIDLPYNPEVPVDTWWDIGIGDSTCIWFTQIQGQYVHVIDLYYNKSVGIDHYAKELQSKPYVYSSHNFPHDMGNTEFGSGRSRVEQAESYFGNSVPLNVLQKLGVEDGINAVRMLFPRLVFNKKRCGRGLEALYNYHREWDDKLKQYKNRPHHDWSSDYADALRYMAIGLTIPQASKTKSRFKTRLKGLRNKRASRHHKSWMTA